MSYLIQYAAVNATLSQTGGWIMDEKPKAGPPTRAKCVRHYRASGIIKQWLEY